MEEYMADGLQILEIISENNSGSVPSEEDLLDWTTQYGFVNVAALADGDQVWVDYENDYGIPTVSFIGPDMTVLAVDTYNTDPGAYLP
jgi:hypothetical protein